MNATLDRQRTQRGLEDCAALIGQRIDADPVERQLIARLLATASRPLSAERWREVGRIAIYLDRMDIAENPDHDVAHRIVTGLAGENERAGHSEGLSDHHRTTGLAKGTRLKDTTPDGETKDV